MRISPQKDTPPQELGGCMLLLPHLCKQDMLSEPADQGESSRRDFIFLFFLAEISSLHPPRDQAKPSQRSSAPRNPPNSEIPGHHIPQPCPESTTAASDAKKRLWGANPAAGRIGPSPPAPAVPPAHRPGRGRLAPHRRPPHRPNPHAPPRARLRPVRSPASPSAAAAGGDRPRPVCGDGGGGSPQAAAPGPARLLSQWRAPGLLGKAVPGPSVTGQTRGGTAAAVGPGGLRRGGRGPTGVPALSRAGSPPSSQRGERRSPSQRNHPLHLHGRFTAATRAPAPSAAASTGRRPPRRPPAPTAPPPRERAPALRGAPAGRLTEGGPSRPAQRHWLSRRRQRAGAANGRRGSGCVVAEAEVPRARSAGGGGRKYPSNTERRGH